MDEESINTTAVGKGPMRSPGPSDDGGVPQRHPSALRIGIAICVISVLSICSFGLKDHITRSSTLSGPTEGALASAEQRVDDVDFEVDMEYVHILSQGIASMISRWESLPLDKGVFDSSSFRSLREAHSSQGSRTFVIGVTGGSSTAGGGGVGFENVWAEILGKNLRSLGFDVEVRNGAQGSTPSIITAPCISFLVGEGIDMVFWEFAMNDDFDRLDYFLEQWIRSAARLNSSKLGLTYFWSLDSSQANLEMTFPVVEHYAQYLDITAVMVPELTPYFPDGKVLRADQHHPTAEIHQLAADALTYAILKSLKEEALLPISSLREGSRKDGGVGETIPLYFPTYPEMLPREVMTWQGECNRAIPSQCNGSVTNIHYMPCNDGETNCNSQAEIEILGKQDAQRLDRQGRWVIKSCDQPLLFKLNISNPGIIILLADPLQGIKVTLDDHILVPEGQKAPPPSIEGRFYPWRYYWKANEIDWTKPDHMLKICLADLAASGGLERIMIFHP